MKKCLILVLYICLAISATACSPLENAQEPAISQSQSIPQSQSAAEPSIPEETHTISIVFVNLTDEVYGAIHSILTVKPMEDDSFQYISNEVLAQAG